MDTLGQLFKQKGFYIHIVMNILAIFILVQDHTQTLFLLQALRLLFLGLLRARIWINVIDMLYNCCIGLY